jgi:hypothetical protein
MADQNAPVVSSVANTAPAVSAAVVTLGPTHVKKPDETRLLASVDQSNAIAPSARINPPAVRMAPDDSNMTRAVAQMLSHHTSNARTKMKTDVRKREGLRHLSEVRRYAQVRHQHGGYLGNPTYRSAGRDEPLMSGGHRAIAADNGGTSANGGYLSPAEMYSMLAHSPVLDDNSGSARASARPMAMPVRSAGGADSADTPSWNGHIDQARVTDVPSQFSK